MGAQTAFLFGVKRAPPRGAPVGWGGLGGGGGGGGVEEPALD